MSGDKTTRTRCWCGAFAEHTEDGIHCDSCGDEIDPELDLKPSGYVFDGNEWVHESKTDGGVVQEVPA